VSVELEEVLKDGEGGLLEEGHIEGVDNGLVVIE